MSGVILLFNGSFDPVTVAHIRSVEYAYTWLKEQGIVVRHIIFSPVHEKYPYKTLTAGSRRAEMLGLAFRSSPLASLMMVDTWEIEHPEGFMPTYRLIEHLKERYQLPIYIVAGTDLLLNQCDASVWPIENLKRMYAHVTFLIVPRTSNGAKFSQDEVISRLHKSPFISECFEKGRIIFLPEEVSNVSSTCVRSTSDPKQLYTLVPTAVADYIIEYGLYSY
ncbi:Nicotinamide-nucleotide adenylyltransferase [Giardia muris]|uniref:Nicotinamide-nucleotide adenylyltransferase n=1 Tax=Giardia muris TaxID=5742 RepID=A0A4Z1T873_GIAMU|nr:Nicotinamide-nucleotide adenylyltransferase [Giardia muris]|eukprot:TNJ30303.1 Nicotinamide-nucleotide adenylyltransferase [Giardia muris]